MTTTLQVTLLFPVEFVYAHQVDGKVGKSFEPLHDGRVLCLEVAPDNTLQEKVPEHV